MPQADALLLGRKTADPLTINPSPGDLINESNSDPPEPPPGAAMPPHNAGLQMAGGHVWTKPTGDFHSIKAATRSARTPNQWDGAREQIVGNAAASKLLRKVTAALEL